MSDHGVEVTARACANIALVKYWGKRDAALNLPATGSLSLTLAELVTVTTVRLDRALAGDEIELDGSRADGQVRARVVDVLELVRARAGIATHARVVSRNHFPTASGLASSASGFAALAVAASRAAGLALSPRELSRLARRGSGSAARSIFGGFAIMHAGAHDDDAFAEAVAGTTLPFGSADGRGQAPAVASPLLARVRMVIAIVGGGAPKSHGSRDAMEHCAATSPLYPAWLAVVPRDLATAMHAIRTGDLSALGELAEANALAMHATALASRPAIVYWQPATLALLAEVRALRAGGLVAWATIDAGPHVKVLTTDDDAPAIARVLAAIPGVTQTIVSAAGGPAELVP